MASHARSIARQFRWDVRTHPFIIVAVPLLTGGLTGLLVNERAPTTTSTATVVVRSMTTDRPFEFSVADRIDPRSLETQLVVLSSRAVREEVERRIGSTPAIAVTVDPSADALHLVARAASVTESRRIVDTYAQVYVEGRQAQQLAAIGVTRSRVQASIGAIERELAQLPPVSVDAPGAVAQRGSLGDQRGALRARLQLLELESSAQSGAAVVTKTTGDGGRRTPLVAGVVGGVALGLALAIAGVAVGRRLRRTLAPAGATAAVAGGVPILAAIPRDRFLRSRPLDHRPRGTASGEAVRFIADLVESWNTSTSVVQVVSAVRQEGSSMVAAQLAASLAERGRKTVLLGPSVERRPSRRGHGLPASLAIEEISTRSGLGGDTLARLRGLYEFVIVDSAPILTSSTALTWSQQVDSSVLVSRPNSVTAVQVAQALEALAAVSEPARGVVLNDIPVDRQGVPLL